MWLGRQDPAQEESRAGWLCGLLCGKHRPQEPSPDSQQEASPCPVTEDLPASPGQEVEDPCPCTSSLACSPWDSSCIWDLGSSEADGRCCFFPGTQRTTRRNRWMWPQRRLLSRTSKSSSRAEKRMRPQHLMFLHTIHPTCLAARQRGQDTLEPNCCKAAVVERIVELIEELPDNSPPGAILANSLIAVGNLSTMTPALEPDLETYLLRAALHAVFTLGTEKDTTQVQDLHRVLPDLLDAMLGNLLAEALDTGRLHYILEHINYWIVSRVSQERARAIRSSTLPEFDNSAEFPRMGHHVAQLALFIGDPAKDISRQAREGVYLLYQLLLHQRSKEPSWEMAPDRRVRLGP
ncbi:maestro heat-like repeat-containing protein family member 7 isoform X1 [Caretta caretta]|uniref:maestro heat-like repeat-containing protein family member 7 isoform X1 n=1 Tax=Caretta caretta TaxID=8467 RepID=UPI003F4BD8DF